MSGSRFFSKLNGAGAEGPSIMVWLSERGVEGMWSTATGPLLIFAEAQLPKGATGVSPHGGGVASSAPVQLLFWGSWWATPEGGQRLWLIENRFQALLASEYFSQLAQYGIAPPHFRGSLIVSKPTPPMRFSGDNDHSPGDMIVDLIENDVFPDPDDEPIAYLVLMPKGFSAPGTTNGAHTTDYDYEFPFDFDWFWWGDGDPIHFDIKRISEIDPKRPKEQDPPVGSIRNVLIRNVIARGKGSCMINGHPESWLEGLSLENVKLFLSADPAAYAEKAVHAMKFRWAKDLKLKDVEVIWEKPVSDKWESALYLEDIQGLALEGFSGRQAKALS
jgi:hypothetical protein